MRGSKEGAIDVREVKETRETRRFLDPPLPLFFFEKLYGF